MTMLFNDGATTCAFAVANGGEVVYRLKQLMKAAGWTHRASSDGTNVSNIAGNANDQITSAAEMNTNHAWFVLAKNNWQMIFRRGTSESSWMIAVVPPNTDGTIQAATVAGTTTTVPVFTTRHALIGTLPDTTASWFSGSSAGRWTCGAEDALDSNMLYLAGWNTTGSTAVGGALFIDEISEETANPNDIAPLVFYAAGGGSNPWLDNSLASDSSGPVAYYRRGLTGEAWLPYAAASWACYQGTATDVTLLGEGYGHNPWVPGQVQVPPTTYFRREKTAASSIVAPGVKGSGKLWRWRGGHHITAKLLREVVANDRIVIGDAVLPWDPSITPPLWQ